jgi:threonine synthase
MRLSQSAFVQLECPECSRIFNPDVVQTCCPDCLSPLFAAYDLPAAKRSLTREALTQRLAEDRSGIWRWSEILPVHAPAFRLSLGEVKTPVLQAANLGKTLGLNALYIKDESRGPLGSLDSRGMVVAAARALELGVRDFVMAAIGSDGVALAACAARSRARAHIYMPKDAPLADQIAVKTFGAELHLLDNPFSDIASQAAESARLHGWFEISAFREPYRCEGTKTIGLELAESFAWNVPDVIIVPTNDGLELLGLWKAFNELEQLGFLGSRRPRMVIVQACGCAPLARAFDEKKERVERWQDPSTVFSSLRVSEILADRLILRTIRESQGTALAVSDEQILACQKELASNEGIFASPQGAAGLAAVKQLIAAGWLDRDERIVLLNSGSGLNYL